jgi:hypothetical protein
MCYALTQELKEGLGELIFGSLVPSMARVCYSASKILHSLSMSRIRSTLVLGIDTYTSRLEGGRAAGSY